MNVNKIEHNAPRGPNRIKIRRNIKRRTFYTQCAQNCDMDKEEKKDILTDLQVIQ